MAGLGGVLAGLNYIAIKIRDSEFVDNRAQGHGAGGGVITLISHCRIDIEECHNHASSPSIPRKCTKQ